MESKASLLFGYGSLIQEQSRRSTVPDCTDAYPVRVHGVSRSWNAQFSGIGFGCTFLGAVREKNASVNGVCIPVTERELERFDERESIYRRVLVDAADVEWIGGSASDTSRPVYFYETLDPQSPSADLPIIQSYVDICLDGALSIDELLGTDSSFSDEFITTTSGWSSHWLNDRVHPRRPWQHFPRASRVDRIIHRLLPAEFSSIRIE